MVYFPTHESISSLLKREKHTWSRGRLIISLIGCNSVDPVHDAVLLVAMLGSGSVNPFSLLPSVYFTPLGRCDDKYTTTAAAAVATDWMVVIHSAHQTKSTEARREDDPPNSSLRLSPVTVGDARRWLVGQTASQILVCVFIPCTHIHTHNVICLL